MGWGVVTRGDWGKVKWVWGLEKVKECESQPTPVQARFHSTMKNPSFHH